MIEVVGLGDGGLQDLPERHRQLIQVAAVVMGGRRHLDLVPDVPGQQRIPWPTPLRERLPELLAQLAGAGPVVALASGDPLLSGIGTTLIDLMGPAAVRIHPTVSSETLARARLGWSALDCRVVTVVGRSLDGLRRHLEPGRLIVLCSDGHTPAQVADLLQENGLGQARLTALWHLDGPDEGQRTATAADWNDAPTPDLVVLAVEIPQVPVSGLAPGLPEDSFDHDGQLTKREVRASALARLRPFRGGVLWDLGAGAGSVGIEWARLAPGSEVVAVERDPVRAQRVRANAASLGVPEAVSVVEGESLAALAQLPAPDAVFIGGGVSTELVEHCLERLRAGGRLVAHAVTLGSEAVLVQAQRIHGGELIRISVEHARPLGSHLSWTPARPVVSWSVTRKQEPV